MSLCTIGTRSVVTVEPSATVHEVARIMDERSVGSVVIVEEGKPVGIVTDRDLVVRVMCRGLDAGTTPVSDVMSTPLHTVGEADEALTAASRMREAQVRRLPVVAEAGCLCGIVTLDDLTHHLSRCYHEMAEAIAQFPVPYEGG